MPHPMGTVAGTTPYPWPYHGQVDPRRLGLLLLAAERPPGGCPPGTVAALAAAAVAAGVRIVVVSGPGPAERAEAWLGDGTPYRLVQATASSAFHASALDHLLRSDGITDLLLAGWGLETSVHSTMRAANDRGYECLLVADATVAGDPRLAAAARSTVEMSGGIFGAVGETAAVIDALSGWSGRTGQERAGPVVPGPVVHAVIDDARKDEVMTDHVEPGAGPMAGTRIESRPYPWPYDGVLEPERTALFLIDWQRDFCGIGGYVDQMGYDLSLTRSGLGPTAAVLAAVRAWGGMVIHTREGHRTDLADCPPNKLWRSRRIGAGIGDPSPCGRILVRGEPGWEIVNEVAPLEGEVIIDKPGKGAFYATDLDLLLRTRGVTHLVFTGITTDVCVHTTIREANDRGYECLLLTDCTGATDKGNYEAAIQMIQMQGGVFGAVAPSSAFLACLDSQLASSIG